MTTISTTLPASYSAPNATLTPDELRVLAKYRAIVSAGHGGMSVTVSGGTVYIWRQSPDGRIELENKKAPE